ncbi:GEVED domain-containing protein [Chryseobacterium sp. MMS23-Vi53]|uniref:GEVED domain-containing protein n=1 Tax=Chryseobacterium sp. MMS23-Vi53 TaxID=3386644 RepID=UPI0039EBACF8
MTKNLLFAFLFLLGISFYQSKNIVTETPKPEFFCDNLPPANVQISSITMTSAVITWTADPTVANYVLRYRIPLGTWTTVTNIIQNSFTLTGLMPCQTYEVQVAKQCPATTTIGAWSNVLTFSTYLNYCAAGSTDTSMMHISNVTVTPSGGLPQMISNSGASNYTDYRPDPTRKVQLLVGSANNSISVSKTWATAPSGSAAVGVWIDFNADGIFQDNEKLMSSPANTSSIATTFFTVPAIAFQTGANCGVAMRVIITQTINSSVCGSFTYGEVEDYGVYLSNTANLSVNELNKNKEGSIYPNPTSDILNISGISGNEFEIYNSVGQKVMQGKISDEKVNVHDLTKGVYFIQIKEKNNVTRLKFIKE